MVTKKHVLKTLRRPHCAQLVLHYLEQSIAQLWPLGSQRAKQKEKSLQMEYCKTGLRVEPASRMALILSDEA